MRNQRKIKSSAANLQAVLLLLVCFVTACYSGQGGELHPQAGEGYSVVKKKNGWEAAQIVFGETSVRIDGSWQESGFNNAFKVENNSDTPFSIDFAKVKLEIVGDAAKTRLVTIYDFSSSIPQEERGETFGDGKLLYESYGNSNDGKPEFAGDRKVTCPPKQKCYYSTVVVFPQTKINNTKSIKISLPPTLDKTTDTEIIFNCGKKKSARFADGEGEIKG